MLDRKLTGHQGPNTDSDANEKGAKRSEIVLEELPSRRERGDVDVEKQFKNKNRGYRRLDSAFRNIEI